MYAPSPTQSTSTHSSSPLQQGQQVGMQGGKPSAESIPNDIASAYKRQKDGQLLWFAAPPTHVMPLSQPTHSVAYLNWLNNKNKN
ncbi:hypothetical protein BDA99DRAFT_565506 [Phascolomyces articulosus]|uniref:Uncharacterized protein n=1 Tax=Phascolomyces articulosus TaxID=60185 RepID=A0AAD5JMT9_9FUNG|nr:hypothetical protein BDA99DRAFT_565506 [Phascolomyces articulosus]